MILNKRGSEILFFVLMGACLGLSLRYWPAPKHDVDLVVFLVATALSAFLEGRSMRQLQRFGVPHSLFACVALHTCGWLFGVPALHACALGCCISPFAIVMVGLGSLFAHSDVVPKTIPKTVLDEESLSLDDLDVPEPELEPEPTLDDTNSVVAWQCTECSGIDIAQNSLEYPMLIPCSTCARDTKCAYETLAVVGTTLTRQVAFCCSCEKPRTKEDNSQRPRMHCRSCVAYRMVKTVRIPADLSLPQAAP